MDLHPRFGLIIIKKSYRMVPETSIVMDLSIDLLSAVTGANNQQVLGVRRFASPRPKKHPGGASEGLILTDDLIIDADAQPKGRDEQHGEASIKNENGAGETFKPRYEEHKAYNQQRTDASRLDNIDEITDAGVAPHTAVKIKDVKGHELDHQHQRQHRLKQDPLVFRDRKIKTHQVCRIPGCDQQQGIGPENNKQIPVQQSGFQG
jgi:hypothetical protein